MFLTILFIAVALVLVMLILPYASGLTKIQIDTTHRQKTQQGQRQQSPSTQQTSQQYGYIPPDEIQQQSERYDELSHEKHYFKDKAHALKEKLQVTQDDMPLKIKLNRFGNENSSLRNRKKEKLDIDTNPNNYDYDIDELIAEESELSRKEQQTEFYKDQVIGKEKEEMV